MPEIPVESIMPFDMTSAQRWEHTEIIKSERKPSLSAQPRSGAYPQPEQSHDKCCTEELYHVDDGTEHGAWWLSKCTRPTQLQSGMYHPKSWHKLTHPARAVRWFVDHGMELPAELSEFAPRSTVSARDRRAARRRGL